MQSTKRLWHLLFYSKGKCSAYYKSSFYPLCLFIPFHEGNREVIWIMNVTGRFLTYCLSNFFAIEIIKWKVHLWGQIVKGLTWLAPGTLWYHLWWTHHHTKRSFLVSFGSNYLRNDKEYDLLSLLPTHQGNDDVLVWTQGLQTIPEDMRFLPLKFFCLRKAGPSNAL